MLLETIQIQPGRLPLPMIIKDLNMRTFLKILFVLLYTNLSASDYYWIGGSGNWSDITHWATTSGGTVTHVQTPTAEDDVFFDINSFTGPNQTVTINSDVAFARNIDFSEASLMPTFSASEMVNLSVFGSLQLTNDMVFDFRGNLFFSSDATGNSIDFNGHDAGSNATFNGTGSWTIINDLSIDDIITIESGEILFLNSKILCEFLYSRSTSARRVTLENSLLTIRGETIDPQVLGRESNTYTARFNTTNLTWTADNSAVEVTAPNVKILLEGSGSIDFGSLSTVNPLGAFAIHSLDDQTTLAFSNQLVLAKNSFMDVSFSVGSLILEPGYRFIFASSKNVSLDLLEAVGTCARSILISASTSGIHSDWTLSQLATTDYLTLSDIHLSTNNATAKNSVDQGNNAGWTINEKSAENRYWIGGSGNWSDGTHWSTVSGGAPSGCVPTAIDDVFFDVNSFNAVDQSVTMDIANAVCRSMSWEGVTNNPSLTGPVTNNLLMHGSLSFDPGMNHSFQGDYYFVGNSLGNTITSAGHSFNKSVYFDHVSGGWGLQDGLDANFSIEFANGTLNTNNQDLTTFRFRSDYTTERSLNLGSSTITIIRRFGSGSHTLLRSDNLTLDAGTSTLFFDGNAMECHTEGNQSLQYHNVVFTQPSSTIRTLTPLGIKQHFNKVIFLNDGQITGDNDMDTLALKNGSTYAIAAERDQNIGILLWDDLCDGLVTLSSFGNGTTLRLAMNQTLEGFSLFNIKFDNNPAIIATGSVDAGSNEGVIFEAGVGRDLYWVGGSGAWHDAANWSSTSGGLGGACIPTILDNVFFDENSFATSNDIITSLDGSSGFCHDLTFTAMGQTGSLSIPNLYVSGNLDLQTTWSLQPNVFMAGELGPQTIRTSGTEMSYLYIDGRADVTQLDDIHIKHRMLFVGNTIYKSNNHSISVEDFSIVNRNENSPAVDLGNSRVTIRGLLRGNIYPLSISGETSTIGNLTSATFDFISTAPAASISSNIDLGHLLFSATDGESRVEIYRFENNFESLRFRGNGTVTGNFGINMDTLVLAAGKSYTFESNTSYAINNMLRARGNNCLPISWRSSESGVDVLLTMPVNIPTLDIDFVEMNGISVVCCNTYFAGNNSTNIGNSNDGWVFGTPDDNPADEGFLGPDIIVCDDDGLTLMPFQANQISSIIWNNGSTDLSLMVDEDATVSALATFTNNCQIRDTLDIRFESSFSIDLGPDTTLCFGSNLLLNPNIPGAEYQWHDQSVGSTFLVDREGVYAVTADLGSCFAVDSIEVFYEEAPVSGLAATASACEGDTIALDVNVSGISVTWPDGSTRSTYLVSSSGEYVVRIEGAACVITDTSTVTFFQNPGLSPLVDTFVCQGATIGIGQPEQGGLGYLWNTGATGSMLEVSVPGRYSLLVTDENGCGVEDSVEITERSSPRFALGADTIICAGEEIEIGTDLIFDKYIWSTGASQPLLEVNQSGAFVLSTEDNGCSYSDTIQILVQAYPIVDFGNDQSICEGLATVLDVGSEDASYLWSDGSTESTLVVTDMGTYSVLVDLNGCVASDTITLETAPTPFFDLGDDLDLCEGDSIQLAIHTDDDWVISWNTGSTESILTIYENGDYVAEAILGNCRFADTVLIEMHPKPIIDLGPDQEKCAENAIELDIGIQTGNILWDDGTTDSRRIIQSAGTYSVEVVSEFGCLGGDETIISDVSCVTFDIFLPNAFSPNGDGINDSYEVGFSTLR